MASPHSTRNLVLLIFTTPCTLSKTNLSSHTFHSHRTGCPSWRCRGRGRGPRVVVTLRAPPSPPPPRPSPPAPPAASPPAPAPPVVPPPASPTVRDTFSNSSPNRLQARSMSGSEATESQVWFPCGSQSQSPTQRRTVASMRVCTVNYSTKPCRITYCSMA